MMISESITTSRPKSPQNSSIQSIHIPIEYNAKMKKQTSCCPIDYLIACILFFAHLCLEYFLIFQWIHNEYYIPALLLCFFIFLSNICNLFQWYSFAPHTTFKLHHFIILFGIIGLLPLLSILYYICKRTKTNRYKREKIIWSKDNGKLSELLLSSSSSSTQPLIASSKTKRDIVEALFSNSTQLLIAQALVRCVRICTHTRKTV